MTTITYKDLDGAAPKTTFHDVAFIAEKSVEVDDDRDAALIDAAKLNPWFEVSSGGAPVAGGNSPYDKGYKAAQAGKDKNVPVSYRSKPEGTAWELGFDDGKKAVGGADMGAIVVAGPMSPGGQTGAKEESPAPAPTAASEAPDKSAKLTG